MSRVLQFWRKDKCLASAGNWTPGRSSRSLESAATQPLRLVCHAEGTQCHCHENKLQFMSVINIRSRLAKVQVMDRYGRWSFVCVCVCVSVGGFEKSVVGLYRLHFVWTAPRRETCPEGFRWNSFARKSVANTDCIGNHANFTVNVTMTQVTYVRSESMIGNYGIVR